MRSGLTTVPLQLRQNASPFWIMLLLSSTAFGVGMIDADRTLGHSEVVTQTVDGTDGEPIESKTVMVPRVTIVATGAMP